MESFRRQNNLRFLKEEKLVKKIIPLLLILFLSAAVESTAGSIVVIAHKDFPTDVLTVEEVQRIFLGKKTTWKNQGKIMPICLKNGKSHESFVRTFLDMNASQFDIFWKKAVFIGTGRPPRSLSGETDVVKSVMMTPGALGYIDSETNHDAVKTIDIK